MADPINLNKARKAKAKAAQKVRASQNRVRFGRTKGQTTASKLETERAARALDQIKRED